VPQACYIYVYECICMYVCIYIYIGLRSDKSNALCPRHAIYVYMNVYVCTYVCIYIYIGLRSDKSNALCPRHAIYMYMYVYIHYSPWNYERRYFYDTFSVPIWRNVSIYLYSIGTCVYIGLGLGYIYV
jgi:rubredoxin